MSLEQSVNELNATIQQLIQQLEAGRQAQGAHHCSGHCGTAKQEVEGPKSEPPAETAKTAAETPSSSSGATNSADQSTAQSDSGKSEQPAGLDYDKDIVPVFSKLVAANRPAAKALIAEYSKDAKRLQEAIKPEQYAEVLAKINKLLEG